MNKLFWILLHGRFIDLLSNLFFQSFIYISINSVFILHFGLWSSTTLFICCSSHWEFSQLLCPSDIFSPVCFFFLSTSLQELQDVSGRKDMMNSFIWILSYPRTGKFQTLAHPLAARTPHPPPMTSSFVWEHSARHVKKHLSACLHGAWLVLVGKRFTVTGSPVTTLSIRLFVPRQQRVLH